MTKKKSKLQVPSVATTTTVSKKENKDSSQPKSQYKIIEEIKAQSVAAAVIPIETKKEPEYVPQPISIKSFGKKTIGNPKSGKFWKKEHKIPLYQKKQIPVSWEKKMLEKARLKRIRDRIKVDREQRTQRYKEIKDKQREKAKRKELNEFKSSSYQIIKDTKKVKKWNKKAKAMIMKMPAEIFYEKYK